MIAPDSPPPRLTVVLPHLRMGGVEKSTVLLANALHGSRGRIRFVLSNNDGPLRDLLAPGIEVVSLGGRRAATSVPALAMLLREDCDVVYSATNARNLVTLAALRLIPAGRRPAAMISEHTSPEAYLAKAKWPGPRRRAMRWLYPRAGALVAPTEGLAEAWLAELGLTRPPPVTLPNPILDDAALALSRRIAAGQGPGRDPDLVLMVGRLHPAKGHAVGLEAFARTHALRPALRLRILGEGAERPALEARVADLGLTRAVEMPGVVRDVPEELARAGLLLLPSHREGFGNVVIEALAAGTPVVATDCAGPRAILSQVPGMGRIVPVGEAGPMADAALDVVNGPGPTRDDRRGGVALAQRYSAEIAAKEFAGAMERLIAGAPPGGPAGTRR